MRCDVIDFRWFDRDSDFRWFFGDGWVCGCDVIDFKEILDYIFYYL